MNAFHCRINFCSEWFVRFGLKVTHKREREKENKVTQKSSKNIHIRFNFHTKRCSVREKSEENVEKSILINLQKQTDFKRTDTRQRRNTKQRNTQFQQTYFSSSENPSGKSWKLKNISLRLVREIFHVTLNS